MHLDIISSAGGADGKTLRVHRLGNQSVVGVNHNEPFRLSLRNDGADVATLVTYDGINVATGTTLNGSNKTSLVRAGSTMSIADVLGERLVFGGLPTELTVCHDPYDLAPLGCISAAVYDPTVDDASFATPKQLLRIYYLSWLDLVARLQPQQSSSDSSRQRGKRRKQTRQAASSVELSRFM
jgi:hypothetical protein